MLVFFGKLIPPVEMFNDQVPKKIKVSSSKKCHSEIHGIEKTEFLGALGPHLILSLNISPPRFLSEEAMAHKMVAATPERAKSLILSGVMAGTHIFKLKDESGVHRPDYKDFRVGKEMAKSIFCKIIVSHISPVLLKPMHSDFTKGHFGELHVDAMLVRILSR